MAGTGPEDLWTLSQEFLDACVAALDTIPTYAVGLDGAPARAFVAHGQPAADCCLVGESMVSTAHGPVPIRDVVAGDHVWAFEEGHLVLRRVVRSIPRGVQPVLRMRGHRRQLIGTADHPMLRLRTRHEKTHSGKPQVWDTEWVGIGELQKGDILVSLDHLRDTGSASELPDGTPLSKDLAWLLGLWVGDGCFNQDRGICLFVHNGVRGKAEQILRDTWNVRPKGDSERIVIWSKELHDVFEQTLGRSHAAEKTVPEIIWSRESPVRRAFLDGYSAADGHEASLGYRQYATASPRLAAEVRMLHIGLGDGVSNLAVKERTQEVTIRGKQVKKALPLHRFTVYPDSPRRGSWILDYRKARRALPDEQFGVSTVSSITEWGEAETFDLEIEDAHNFIADGLVVHNCPQLTVHVAAVTESPTGQTIGQSSKSFRTRRTNLVGLVATLFRCVPVPDSNGNPPPIADMEAAGQQIQADGWALWNHIYNLIAADQLFETCGEVYWDGLRALQPQGGCGGFVLIVRVSQDGYEEAIGT